MLFIIIFIFTINLEALQIVLFLNFNNFQFLACNLELYVIIS
jgi:hypothetical protein